MAYSATAVATNGFPARKARSLPCARNAKVRTGTSHGRLPGSVPRRNDHRRTTPMANKRSASDANLFCKRGNLTNEASVENWFVDKLLVHLGFRPEDQLLKSSIEELKVGRGSQSSLYRPDYIILVNGFPALVIDAKATSSAQKKSWQTCCRLPRA